MIPPVLDVCCGTKAFWFDKQDPRALFHDKRKEECYIKPDVGHPARNLIIDPDVVGDFTNLQFPDNTFKMVVFDPPHVDNLGDSSWMAKKYGKLFPTWETDIKQGFDECMRVLEPNGVLIFKWNEIRIKLSQLLKVVEVQPLFGHTSGKHGRTIWLSFMKCASCNEA